MADPTKPIAATNDTPRTLSDRIAEAIGKGQTFFVGEWRGFKAEAINYTSKQDGKAQTMKLLRHNVEVGSDNAVEAVAVTVNLPDDTDVTRVMVPFRKGQQVLVAIQSQIVDQGVKKVRALDIIGI